MKKSFAVSGFLGLCLFCCAFFLILYLSLSLTLSHSLSLSLTLSYSFYNTHTHANTQQAQVCLRRISAWRRWQRLREKEEQAVTNTPLMPPEALPPHPSLYLSLSLSLSLALSPRQRWCLAFVQQELEWDNLDRRWKWHRSDKLKVKQKSKKLTCGDQFGLFQFRRCLFFCRHVLRSQREIIFDPIHSLERRDATLQLLFDAVASLGDVTGVDDDDDDGGGVDPLPESQVPSNQRRKSVPEDVRPGEIGGDCFFPEKRNSVRDVAVEIRSSDDPASSDVDPTADADA